MLVTQRRQGESILIGGNVEVTVLEISGNSVRLGIKAPREVEIQRLEVVLTKKQNLAAAQSVVPDRMKQVLQKIGVKPEPPANNCREEKKNEK